MHDKEKEKKPAMSFRTSVIILLTGCALIVISVVALIVAVVTHDDRYLIGFVLPLSLGLYCVSMGAKSTRAFDLQDQPHNTSK